MLARCTSAVGTMIEVTVRSPEAISATSVATAWLPISANDWRIVVSGGQK